MTVKQENILQSQLDALVELTAQAGFENLIPIFIKNIRELFAHARIILNTGDGEKTAQELSFTESHLQKMIEQWLQRAHSFKTGIPSELAVHPSGIVVHDREGDWTQFPLTTAAGTIGFLRVSGRYSDQNILLAESHIRIFLNQINLLNINERDALTGLYNRQAFDQRLKHLLENRNQNRKSDTSMDNIFALVDIDHFKRINDTLGHIYGDEVLILFARILQHSIREDDWVFRYGGEEFAIVLHNCDLPLGGKILERIRSNIEAYDFPQLERVTCSMGYTSVDAKQPLGVNFQRADAALYYAKENGRNQLHSYDQLIEQRSLQQMTPSTGEIELF